MIPKGGFTPRKPLPTVCFVGRWQLWQLRRSGVAFLLGVEGLTLLLIGVVLYRATGDTQGLMRLGALLAVSIAYAEITDRVERVWIWLHTDRGAWVGQSSILCLAGTLVLPLWAAVIQVLVTYGHIGIRNKRFATAPSHRWVWTGTTAVLATVAGSLAFRALGGDIGRVGALDLLVIAGVAVLYSAVNLAVLLAGMYLVLRPPSVRALIPARSEFAYEGAKLLLAVVAAALLVHTPVLMPAVLVFAAMLHRSTLVGELRTVAATDDKTGLLTSRAWNEQALATLARCEQAGRPAALVLLDLDHFKRVNDTHGHAAGDRALAAIGAVLTAEVRTQDVVGRYGGEEFVVLLPGVDQHRALEIAQRLRESIANAPTDARVTASLGVASLGRDGHGLEELLDAADAAMYRAKHLGRDTVCAASAA